MSKEPEELEFGNFRILRQDDGALWELGRGGFGTTYKAEHKHLMRTCALKVINDSRVASEDARRRFLQEARAAASLQHPHIAAVYDFGESDGTFYYAMEYCAGGDLEKYSTDKGALTWQELEPLVIQISGALLRAHESGMLHRDLKPSNIMLASDEEELPQLKLIDFGLVKILDHVETATTQVMMTQEGAAGFNPLTASPEQLLDEELDERSDLFSFGVTLLYLLCGGVPFGNVSAPLMMAQRLDDKSYDHLLPESLTGYGREIVSKLLQKKRDNRFRTAADILTAISNPTEIVISEKAPEPEIEPEDVVEVETDEPEEESSETEIDWVSAWEVKQIQQRGRSGSYYKCVGRQQGIPDVVMFLPDEESVQIDTIIENAEKLTGLRDSNLLGYYDVGHLDGERAYLTDPFLGQGGRLLDLLQAEGHFTLQTHLSLFQQISKAIDDAAELALPGLELNASMILVDERYNGAGAMPSNSDEWLEYYQQQVSQSSTFAKDASLSILPKLEEPSDEEDIQATVTLEDLATDPLTKFGSLIYRSISGMSVRPAAYMRESGYVSTSNLGEESNRFLAEIIAGRSEVASATDIIIRLCECEGVTWNTELLDVNMHKRAATREVFASEIRGVYQRLTEALKAAKLGDKIEKERKAGEAAKLEKRARREKELAEKKAHEDALKKKEKAEAEKAERVRLLAEEKQKEKERIVQEKEAAKKKELEAAEAKEAERIRLLAEEKQKEKDRIAQEKEAAENKKQEAKKKKEAAAKKKQAAALALEKKQADEKAEKAAKVKAAKEEKARLAKEARKTAAQRQKELAAEEALKKKQAEEAKQKAKLAEKEAKEKEAAAKLEAEAEKKRLEAQAKKDEELRLEEEKRQKAEAEKAKQEKIAEEKRLREEEEKAKLAKIAEEKRLKIIQEQAAAQKREAEKQKKILAEQKRAAEQQKQEALKLKKEAQAATKLAEKEKKALEKQRREAEKAKNKIQREQQKLSSKESGGEGWSSKKKPLIIAGAALLAVSLVAAGLIFRGGDDDNGDTSTEVDGANTDSTPDKTLDSGGGVVATDCVLEIPLGKAGTSLPSGVKMELVSKQDGSSYGDLVDEDGVLKLKAKGLPKPNSAEVFQIKLNSKNYELKSDINLIGSKFTKTSGAGNVYRYASDIPFNLHGKLECGLALGNVPAVYKKELLALAKVSSMRVMHAGGKNIPEASVKIDSKLKVSLPPGHSVDENYTVVIDWPYFQPLEIKFEKGSLSQEISKVSLKVIKLNLSEMVNATPIFEKVEYLPSFKEIKNENLRNLANYLLGKRGAMVFSSQELKGSSHTVNVVGANGDMSFMGGCIHDKGLKISELIENSEVSFKLRKAPFPKGFYFDVTAIPFRQESGKPGAKKFFYIPVPAMLSFNLDKLGSQSNRILQHYIFTIVYEDQLRFATATSSMKVTSWSESSRSWQLVSTGEKDGVTLNLLISGGRTNGADTLSIAYTDITLENVKGTMDPTMQKWGMSVVHPENGVVHFKRDFKLENRTVNAQAFSSDLGKYSKICKETYNGIKKSWKQPPSFPEITNETTGFLVRGLLPPTQ